MEGSRAAKQQAAGEAAVAAASPAAPSPFASAPAPALGGTDGGSSPTAPSAAPEHPPSVGSAPAQVELGSSPGGSPSQEGGPLHAHMCVCMCWRLGTGCAWDLGAGGVGDGTRGLGHGRAHVSGRCCSCQIRACQTCAPG